MSDEHESNGAHEARIAELERQLAALQPGRPVRSRMSLRRVAAFGLVVVLLALPSVVLANHQFSDVKDTTPFHKEIGAIAKAGITGGFGDGTYRPSDPVTRQSMAAFLERGFGRVGLAAGTTTSSLDVIAGASQNASVPIVDLTITVPGATNSFTPNQLVHLQGRVQFVAPMSSANGCPCEFTAVIQDVLTGSTGIGNFQGQTFDTTAVDPMIHGVSVEALFAAPPGPRTYQLRVYLSWRRFETNATSFLIHHSSSLSGETFPFGSTGGNTP